MCVGATRATLVLRARICKQQSAALSPVVRACVSAIRTAFVIGFTFRDGLHPVGGLEFVWLPRLPDWRAIWKRVVCRQVRFVYPGQPGIRAPLLSRSVPLLFSGGVRLSERQVGHYLALDSTLLSSHSTKELLRQFLVTYGNDRMHHSDISPFANFHSGVCFVTFPCQCPTTF